MHMGNLCCIPRSMPVLDCIHQMQSVEKTLGHLIQKYELQIRQEQLKARQKIHRKVDCMLHVRTIHIIRHHKKKLEARLTACMSKRYQLESLNVTKMHIEAVKMTSETFERFLHEHDIQRVEALQDTLSEMISDACEISETLQEEVGPLRVDDDELEQEYEALCSEIQLPELRLPIAPNHAPMDSEHREMEFEMVPLTG